MNTRQSDFPRTAAEQVTLGTFLRTRRARLTPSQVGLPSRTQRRTPGLRREEVAQLAEISPEWYTYLEQDREVHPSREVIDRIAHALRLNWAEHEYLRSLAFPRSVNTGPGDVLPQDLQRFMDDLGHRPAYVVNDIWDIVGWNRAANAVFPGLSSDPERPNLVTSVFLSPDWRRLYREWEPTARKMLALFRLSVAAHAGNPRCSELLGKLTASAEFSAWWQEQDVRTSSSGSKELIHPRAGALELDYWSFRTTDEPSLTMIVFTPHDDADRQKLRTLTDGSDAVTEHVVGLAR